MESTPTYVGVLPNVLHVFMHYWRYKYGQVDVHEQLWDVDRCGLMVGLQGAELCSGPGVGSTLLQVCGPLTISLFSVHYVRHVYNCGSPRRVHVAPTGFYVIRVPNERFFG